MADYCDGSDPLSQQFREQLDRRMQGIDWPLMNLDTYREAISSGKRVAVLDVRKAPDCCYIGPHHPGAVLYNVPLKRFPSAICDLPLDDYDVLVCLCVGGPMSAVAACMLRMLGHDNAWFLAGGIKGLVSISDLDDPGTL